MINKKIMTQNKKNIVILGNGSFGTALAVILSKKNKVTLWGRDADYLKYMHREKRNPKYLPNIFLEKVHFESNLQKAVTNQEILLLCIPSKSIANFIPQLEPLLAKEQIIISGAKGFVDDQLTTCSQLLKKKLEQKIMVLSGPSHAEEIAQGMPTFINLATDSEENSLQEHAEYQELIRQSLQSRFFKVFLCSDTTAIETAASLKNVIAIASGIVDTYQFGINTKSALVTKGLEEIILFCKYLGYQEKVITGLGGLGDLIVTCMSKYSRNFQTGMYLGKGYSLEEINQKMHMTIEGINTANNVYSFLEKHKIKLPIIESIYKILFTKISTKKQMLKLIHSYL